MNYETDIEIDESALDIEWLNQPALFMKYARNAARMRQELDRKKQELDIAKAEADKKIRMKPEKFGLEKITEAAVANAILTEQGYKDAYEVYLDAKYESDMASGAVAAFEQRKNALENMVKLNGQSYFAGPRVPRNLTDERAKKQQAVDNKVASRMSRNK